MSFHKTYSKFLNSTSQTRCQLSDYENFANALSESENIVALTGAGVSAKSVIPSSVLDAGGIWENLRIIDIATPDAFRSNPGVVWEFFNYQRNIAFNAKPNNVHYSLAKFENICKNKKKKFVIITENVDGLHKRAGSNQIIELRGSLERVICTYCQAIEVNLKYPICDVLHEGGDCTLQAYGRPWISPSKLPKCKYCKNLLRPNVTFFREHIDNALLEKSKDLMDRCDLCLVIGTSLLKHPTVQFSSTFLSRGIPIAEFDSDETSSKTFDYSFTGPCVTTLPKALGVKL